ncbi:type II secretion system protein GspC [Thioalkalivibrio nitratireducens]|nr:type II secretion system protein GspC [Thioalkalivibrio nitratireducens]
MSASVLPRTVSIVLLLAIGVLAARVTWQIVEPQIRPPVSIEIRSDPGPAADREPSESPLAHVAGLALFGELGTPADPAPVVAPETRLRLRLLGLMAGDHPERGWAIIAEGGSQERLYTVGDTIAGQARLHQIHADRVILERDGRLETLRLPRADGNSGAVAGASPRAAAAAPAARGQPSLQRSEWLGDPERLMQAVQARPIIRAGELHGVELRPVRNAREFRQAGLQAGDVITSVNGIPLSAIDDIDRLLQDLAGQSRVDIVLERNGQSISLGIQLLD